MENALSDGGAPLRGQQHVPTPGASYVVSVTCVSIRNLDSDISRYLARESRSALRTERMFLPLNIFGNPFNVE